MNSSLQGSAASAGPCGLFLTSGSSGRLLAAFGILGPTRRDCGQFSRQRILSTRLGCLGTLAHPAQLGEDSAAPIRQRRWPLSPAIFRHHHALSCCLLPSYPLKLDNRHPNRGFRCLFTAVCERVTVFCFGMRRALPSSEPLANHSIRICGNHMLKCWPNPACGSHAGPSYVRAQPEYPSTDVTPASSLSMQRFWQS
jgi:hypothetical protein